MSRKKDPDINKIKRLTETLKKYPNGLWIRELSRKSGVDKSAVSRYISTYMKEKVEIEDIGNLIKIVKLTTLILFRKAKRLLSLNYRLNYLIIYIFLSYLLLIFK